MLSSRVRLSAASSPPTLLKTAARLLTAGRVENWTFFRGGICRGRHRSQWPRLRRHPRARSRRSVLGGALPLLPQPPRRQSLRPPRRPRPHGDRHQRRSGALPRTRPAGALREEPLLSPRPGRLRGPGEGSPPLAGAVEAGRPGQGAGPPPAYRDRRGGRPGARSGVKTNQRAWGGLALVRLGQGRLCRPWRGMGGVPGGFLRRGAGSSSATASRTARSSRSPRRPPRSAGCSASGTASSSPAGGRAVMGAGLTPSLPGRLGRRRDPCGSPRSSLSKVGGAGGRESIRDYDTLERLHFSGFFYLPEEGVFAALRTSRPRLRRARGAGADPAPGLKGSTSLGPRGAVRPRDDRSRARVVPFLALPPGGAAGGCRRRSSRRACGPR